MTLPKLPLSIQNFAEIRQGNICYVDKTELVWKLVDSGKAYFLSRPRRFGKS
ncbi:AAA family ATPase, partial [Methylicorpusculum sp.]